MKIFVYDREYILLSPRCHQTYYFILSLVLYRNMVWECRNGYHAAWCARDIEYIILLAASGCSGSLACKLDPQVASPSTGLRGPDTKRLWALWLCNYHQKPLSGISSPTQSTACSMISLARYVRSRYLCNHYRCLCHGLWDSGDY